MMPQNLYPPSIYGDSIEDPRYYFDSDAMGKIHRTSSIEKRIAIIGEIEDFEKNWLPFIHFNPSTNEYSCSKPGSQFKHRAILDCLLYSLDMIDLLYLYHVHEYQQENSQFSPKESAADERALQEHTKLQKMFSGSNHSQILSAKLNALLLEPYLHDINAAINSIEAYRKDYPDYLDLPDEDIPLSEILSELQAIRHEITMGESPNPSNNEQKKPNRRVTKKGWISPPKERSILPGIAQDTGDSSIKKIEKTVREAYKKIQSRHAALTMDISDQLEWLCDEYAKSMDDIKRYCTICLTGHCTSSRDIIPTKPPHCLLLSHDDLISAPQGLANHFIEALIEQVEKDPQLSATIIPSLTAWIDRLESVLLTGNFDNLPVSIGKAADTVTEKLHLKNIAELNTTFSSDNREALLYAQNFVSHFKELYNKQIDYLGSTHEKARRTSDNHPSNVMPVATGLRNALGSRGTERLSLMKNIDDQINKFLKKAQAKSWEYKDTSYERQHDEFVIAQFVEMLSHRDKVLAALGVPASHRQFTALYGYLCTVNLTNNKICIESLSQKVSETHRNHDTNPSSITEASILLSHESYMQNKDSGPYAFYSLKNSLQQLLNFICAYIAYIRSSDEDEIDPALEDNLTRLSSKGLQTRRASHETIFSLTSSLSFAHSEIRHGDATIAQRAEENRSLQVAATSFIPLSKKKKTTL